MITNLFDKQVTTATTLRGRYGRGVRRCVGGMAGGKRGEKGVIGSGRTSPAEQSETAEAPLIVASDPYSIISPPPYWEDGGGTMREGTQEVSWARRRR